MRNTISKAVTGALFASTASAQIYPNQTSLNHTCQLQSPLLSCPPQDPSQVDSCCVETYGGLVLSTQFWNTYTGRESEGQLLPAKTFTLHGLWPDWCNGSYTQYCDLTRQYDPSPSPNTTNGLKNGTAVLPYTGPNIGTFLEPFGRFDLLAYMNTYWVAWQQDNPAIDFWGHEFSKHGACYSTFNVPCYGPLYRENEEVVDFFETAIKYYQRFPTFAWLEDAGITPSNSTTYSYSDFRDVLFEHHGGIPFIGCSGPRYNTTTAGKNSTDSGYTVLSEVWYYEHVYGRPQEGNTISVNASSTYLTNCAKTSGAINYYERSNGSEKVPTIPY
ncbi:ribonuclease T2 [Dothidotthia symphoricarpi CBS 119687]|uniref:ribonuclease T2 n=1 Tax=Dothidotthia symphoricarpi CBS 119687 TaxID=1392245 RepID=A0A6A6APK1_9PLEO|nr:ribonuclease T2 [Dothidotthia symphoricarpi CBS 119687]KAF2132955.1 ribonuclease T2 [Dothidotthia symphoricarpi CBS 119687]